MKNGDILVVFLVVNLIIALSIIIKLSGIVETRGERSVEKEQKPNIVLFVADDYGWNDIGYHGSEIRTPTLDGLAAQGVKLENYYVQPMCSPSRTQLLSGMYQIHTGMQHFILKIGQPDGLPVKFSTIADKLKEAGYSTHAIGKWHVGFYTKDHLPINRGFDTFYGHLNCGQDYYNHVSCNKNFCGLDLWENDGPINDTCGTYSTLRFADRAVDLINKHNKQKPLFLYLSFRSVHRPLEVPAQYIEPYKHIKNEDRRIYAGMVGCLDEAVYNVTMSLKQNDLWKNTIFIFTTDNGGMTSYGGNNSPLRGGKQELWEGGIRGVAFITSPWLDDKVKGTISRSLMHVSDWYPTLVNLASRNQARLQDLDGVDQWTAINGGPEARTEILHNIDPLSKPKGRPRPNSAFKTTTTAALRSGHWKILTGNPGEGAWIPSPEDPSMKTIVPKKTRQNVWLYNITADPLEKQEVSDQYPEVVDELLRKLKNYEDTSVPCRFPKIDPKSNPERRGGFWGPWM